MHKPIIQGSVAWQDLYDQGYVVLSKADYEALTQRWRPIKTAPKDGTEILIYDRRSDVFGQIQISCWWAGGWHLPAYDEDAENPIYWMPLPEPPKEK